MSGGHERDLITFENKGFIKVDRSGLNLAHAPFHKINRRRRRKNAAMRANVIGMRVGNATRLAVAAGIQRERGIVQADGFIVREQGSAFAA